MHHRIPHHDARSRTASPTRTRNLAATLTIIVLTLAAPRALALQTPANPPPASKIPASDPSLHHPAKKHPTEAEAVPPPLKSKTAFDYNLPGPDGRDVPLATFKGKYILLVNLARKSSYNDQLSALIKLNDTYKDKGLVVLGIPSNDFGATEPGTPAEVKTAYAAAKVDFPVMGPARLTGDDPLPIYTFLTKGEGVPPGGPVHWNYTKFIVDKQGKVIARLDPDVSPDSPEMLSTLDQILAGTFKPKKAPSKSAGPGEAAEDDDE